MTPAELKSEADRARREGRLDDAEDLLRQAVAMLRTGGETPALAHTIRHLGDLYRHQGRVEQATRCCEEGLNLYRRCGDAAPPLDVANALRSMALVCELSGDKENARASWAEAKALYHACGVQRGVAESEKRLASLL